MVNAPVDFVADVEMFLRKTALKVDTAIEAVGQKALTRVKELTPVRTGTLRASWVLTRGKDVLPTERGTAAGAIGGIAGSVAGEQAYAQGMKAAGKTVGKLGGAMTGALGSVIGEAAMEGRLPDMTFKTAANVAAQGVGTWGGTAAGAAIGTALMPGVGTAIGGVVGGVIGSFGGSAAVDFAFGPDQPLTMSAPPLSASFGNNPMMNWVISNPVVYARRVEFGFQGTDDKGRTYHQQGRHMLAQTIAELPAIAQSAVAEAQGAQNAG